MLPAFHGERMRSYEPMVTEIVDAEIDSWPLGEEFPIHPRMQAITLEVILRVVFGVADGPAARAPARPARNLLTETASPAIQLIALAAAPLRRRQAVWAASRIGCARSTTCSTPRSPSTARATTSRSATTSSRR